MADVSDIAKAALVAFLKSNITGLQVLDEWPYANQTLQMPSVTVTDNKPTRTPSFNVQVSASGVNGNGQIVANEYVADWEDTFQLDLWTRTKAERTSFTSQILALFNSQEIDGVPDGLSLVMTAHFNEIARFEIHDKQTIDDQASAQRQERRQKITVLMNCREIAQRTYYAIKNLQVNAGASGSDALTDDTTETENHILFAE